MKVTIQKKYRQLFLVVAGAMMLSTPLYAKDYTAHWAERQIDAWSESGIIYGEGEGIFKPNGFVTRAELAAFIDRIFQYDMPESPRRYDDIQKGEWYEENALSVVSHGIMYVPGTRFNPSQHVTREEVAYAMAKAYNISPVVGQEIDFLDGTSISKWAADSVQALAQKGHLTGYPDGSFKPLAPITRAEFITLLDQMTTQYIHEVGTYTKDIKGNVVINESDVVLKDTSIEGNLYITAGVGNGKVTLDNVKVNGSVYIRGGALTMSGAYNTVEVETTTPVQITKGTVKQLNIFKEQANVHLQKDTVVDYLLVGVEKAKLKLEGDIKQSSQRDLADLHIESAGVFMNGVFSPVQIEDNTIIINLKKLASESVSDIMNGLIIYTNKDEAYLGGYDGIGRLQTNTQYDFRRADQELGMVQNMLDQVIQLSPKIGEIAHAVGVTPNTVFGILTDDGEISLSYMMAQYDSVRQLAQQYAGISLPNSYEFKRNLYYKSEAPITITIRLEIR